MFWGALNPFYLIRTACIQGVENYFVSTNACEKGKINAINFGADFKLLQFIKVC